MEFRLYESADFGGCLDLIHRGHDPNYAADRFRWLHEENPWGPSRIALCEAAGRIVGIYSVVPKLLRSPAGQWMGGRDVDPVVDPEFRGQRLFGKLLNFGLTHFAGVDIYFNFANPASIKGFERAGWQRITGMADRVYQLGYRKLASPEFLLWSFNRLAQRRRPAPTTRELSPAELSELLAGDPEPSLGPRLGVWRTGDYLRWRYLNHPFHTYRYFWAGGDGDGFGLAICRDDTAHGELLVIDLAGFGRQPNLPDWLELWSGLLPYHRVVTWFAVPAHHFRGFFENPIGHKTGLPFLVRGHPECRLPAGTQGREDWFICRGDLEVL